MDVKEQVLKIGAQAKAASRELAKLSSRRKNAILEAMADELDAQREWIKTENMKDLEAGRAAGLSAAMIDRLELTDKRIDGMINGLRDVAVLPDPVGSEISTWNRPNALEIQKGEPVEWIVADKANIILSRPEAPPNPVEVGKKTKRPCGTRSTGCSNSATRPGGCART